VSDPSQWRRFWQEKGRHTLSDYELDRGTRPRGSEIEALSIQEQLRFIDPQSRDVVFDAGCGTGVNELLLHSVVQRIIGMDYSDSGLARCKRRISADNIKNVDLIRGDVVALPLPDSSMDRILCMSVLQFLTSDETRRALQEFARILKPQGTLILHVKNLSSLYLSTLWTAKRLLRLAGKQVKLEYFRPYRWYVRELRAAGFQILDYSSFNLLMIEAMPQPLVQFLQRVELRHHTKFPAFLRRHGSELKIKARIVRTDASHRTPPNSSASSSRQSSRS